MGLICSSNTKQPTFNEKELPTFSHNPNKIIKEYRMEDCIAYLGPYYSVYKCTHLKTGRMFALRKHMLSAKSEKTLLYELSLSQGLNHPSAIKVVEYFKTDLSLFIINELFDGKNLPQYVIDAPKFEEPEIVNIIRQLLAFVDYLHERQIINRNLTPANLMYNGQIVKVINFNKAVRFKHGQRFSESASGIHYRAPEMIKGKYNSRVDVWAVGIIAAILLTGKPPFDGTNDNGISQEILNKEITEELFKDHDLSQEALDFLKLILTKSKSKRPKARELLEHPWIKSLKPRGSNLKLNAEMVQNLKDFNFNDKFQKAIYAFLVSRIANEEEKNKALKEFIKLDANGDGLLSKEEIITGLKTLSIPVDEKEASRLFTNIDRKNAGVIEYKDFLEAFVDRRDILQEDNLLSCFDLLDTNKVGGLTLEDLRKVFGDSVEDEYIKKKFRKYAKGNYINKEKFLKMLKDVTANSKEVRRRK